jgi:hypothetical protein
MEREELLKRIDHVAETVIQQELERSQVPVALMHAAKMSVGAQCIDIADMSHLEKCEYLAVLAGARDILIGINELQESVWQAT